MCYVEKWEKSSSEILICQSFINVFPEIAHFENIVNIK